MIPAIGIAMGEGTLTADAFPGRWNPRRAIPPDVEPAATAAALALEGAGWWRPGSGEACAGGLIVACDHASHVPAARFARELRDASASAVSAVGPSGFLFSLPSSTAAVLGLLFGLTDYQSTVVGGALAGAQALRHALDLLALRRLKRVLLAVLSTDGGERVAVAWCLDPVLRDLLALDCGVVAAGQEATILGPEQRFPAAALLLEASARVGRLPGAQRIALGGAWISMNPKGSPE